MGKSRGVGYSRRVEAVADLAESVELARRRPSELEEEGGAHDALALGIDGVLINN